MEREQPEKGVGQSADDTVRRSLLWGLDRLCLWGELDGVESADAHVRVEAAASARLTLEQLAFELQPDSA